MERNNDLWKWGINIFFACLLSHNPIHSATRLSNQPTTSFTDNLTNPFGSNCSKKSHFSMQPRKMLQLLWSSKCRLSSHHSSFTKTESQCDKWHPISLPWYIKLVLYGLHLHNFYTPLTRSQCILEVKNLVYSLTKNGSAHIMMVIQFYGCSFILSCLLGKRCDFQNF